MKSTSGRLSHSLSLSLTSMWPHPTTVLYDSIAATGEVGHGHYPVQDKQLQGYVVPYPQVQSGDVSPNAK